VGKISAEPPEFHIEAIVDGTRFIIAPEIIFAGYQKRRNVRQSLFNKVEIVKVPPVTYTSNTGQNSPEINEDVFQNQTIQ